VSWKYDQLKISIYNHYVKWISVRLISGIVWRFNRETEELVQTVCFSWTTPEIILILSIFANIPVKIL
jgi:hypothetical protein